jgi:hemolysin III
VRQAAIASTLYHALPAGRAKRVFRVIDHSSIFLLIAGSYTPFTLGVLRGAWGWALFGVAWGLALAGIVFKSVGKTSHPILSTGLYLLMGLVGRGRRRSAVRPRSGRRG